MPAATKEEIVLHLPRNVIEMVRSIATDRGESPDEVVAELLQFALPPLRQQALDQPRKQVRKQKSQSKSELLAHVHTRLNSAEHDRLTKLLELNKSGRLSDEERLELEHCFDRIEELATAKAAAIWRLSGKPTEPDAVS